MSAGEAAATSRRTTVRALGPQEPEQLRRSVAMSCLKLTDQLAEDLARCLREQLPELKGPSRAVLRACSSNAESILLLLAEGQLEPEVRGAPEATLTYTRQAVQRGVPLDSLLRAIRVGHAFLWDWWSKQLEVEAGLDGMAALRSSSALMFEHFDRICAEIATAYNQAREQWTRSVAARRWQTVQQILAGSADDVGALGARLGYALEVEHVALILWSEGSPPGALERAAQATAATFGRQAHLVVEIDPDCAWLWCGVHPGAGARLAEELEQHLQDDGVCMAIGKPGRGLDGFRSSHTEARRARRLGGWGPSRATVSYRELELACLMATDREALRRFVAAQLGGLAGKADATVRVRETLHVFLRNGCSQKRAASGLGVHPNTVGYRLQQAEELRGRSIDDERLELEVALMACAVMGDGLIA